jgi:hypothetical protein
VLDEYHLRLLCSIERVVTMMAAIQLKSVTSNTTSPVRLEPRSKAGRLFAGH